MTDDTDKREDEAPAEPPEPPEPQGIPLSALAEEMGEEADFHRNRKLYRAVQVDELRGQNAALAEQVEKLTAALEKVAPTKGGKAN